MRLTSLLIGQRKDPHIASVAAALEARGVSTLVFDRFNDTDSVSYPPSPNSPLHAPIVDQLAAADGAAVWLRMKPPIAPVRTELAIPAVTPTDPVGPYEARLHWRSQWISYCRGLTWLVCQELGLGRELNAGALWGAASLKVVQLAIAKRCGFEIPTTVVGNSATALKSAFYDHVLYKPLTGDPFGGLGSVTPASLPLSDVTQGDRVSVAPAIYQNQIEKAYELRINATRDLILTTKINSQASPRGRLDWRMSGPRPDLYQSVSTPDCVLQPIQGYLEAAGLDLGVFDIAVDSDGTHVFLECNPAGQWLLLEKGGDVRIVDAVAETLRELAVKNADERSLGSR